MSIIKKLQNAFVKRQGNIYTNGNQRGNVNVFLFILSDNCNRIVQLLNTLRIYLLLTWIVFASV